MLGNQTPADDEGGQLADGAQRISIKDINWNINYYINAALIILDADAELGEYVRPLELTDTVPPVGTVVTTMGYGTTENGNSSLSQLKKVDQLIPDKLYCDMEFMVHGQRPPSSFAEVCTGNSTGDYTNVCGLSDSGAPLVYKSGEMFYLVGLGFRLADTNCPAYNHYAAFANIPNLVSDLMPIINCSISGIEVIVNSDSPLKGPGRRDREIIPKCPDGSSPLCVTCDVANKASCTKYSRQCQRSQVYQCSMEEGLTCSARDQKKVVVKKIGKRKVRRQCQCCDYRLKVLCPKPA